MKGVYFFVEANSEIDVFEAIMKLRELPGVKLADALEPRNGQKQELIVVAQVNGEPQTWAIRHIHPIAGVETVRTYPALLIFDVIRPKPISVAFIA